MTITEALDWLQSVSISRAVAENEILFPWIEGLHVLAFATVVGSISVIDLRLLGIASRERPIARIMQDVLPVTWCAFALATLTGMAMFASHALEYSRNPAFKLKTVALAAIGLNMVYFHRVICRNMTRWSALPNPPLRVKLAGATSILLWISVVFFGRWIGFANI